MSTHAHEPQSNPSTKAEAAAEWIARRDRGLTAAEQREFEAWRAADPGHASELARIESTWGGFERLRNVAEMEAMADAAMARAQARRMRRRVVRFASVTLAAAAAVAIGLLGWRHSLDDKLRAPTSPGDYRVLASTSRKQVLPDGSVAVLNGASRIDLDYTATERRVRLVEGEAHFSVVKNPERPFLVTAGAVTVRAVGTAFNVRLESASIEVLVTEGKVKVEDARPAPPRSAGNEPAAPTKTPAPLVAGQRAVIERRADEAARQDIAVDEPGPAAMEEALAWQKTRLVFNNTALSDVVEAFNRYNQHRLVIGDPALRRRTLTGTFRADNLEGFIRLLKASLDVKAEPRAHEETVLLPLP